MGIKKQWEEREREIFTNDIEKNAHDKEQLGNNGVIVSTVAKQ